MQLIPTEIQCKQALTLAIEEETAADDDELSNIFHSAGGSDSLPTVGRSDPSPIAMASLRGASTT